MSKNESFFSNEKKLLTKNLLCVKMMWKRGAENDSEKGIPRKFNSFA